MIFDMYNFYIWKKFVWKFFDFIILSIVLLYYCIIVLIMILIYIHEISLNYNFSFIINFLSQWYDVIRFMHGIRMDVLIKNQIILKIIVEFVFLQQDCKISMIIFYIWQLLYDMHNVTIFFWKISLL